MPIEYKDYYKILGVARTASEDELRKAFRKLARQYHPDVAKTNKAQAEDKFKELNEAYEVLSDPAKRKKYDELGPNWRQGSEFHPPPGWEQFGRGNGRRRSNGRRKSPPADFQFEGTGFSDFFEQFFGSAGNGGARPGFSDVEMAQRGQDVEAEILVTLEEAFNGSIRSISLRRHTACSRCQGAGEANGRPCSACGGSGQVEKTDTHKVKIPVGVREGQKLRVPGQGEPGAGGGEPGDLFLHVRFGKHPDLEVDGDNLVCDVEITPWEAVLGTNVSIPTLTEPVNIKIPPGTQNGQKLRVRGRGLPIRSGGSGDLHVVARVQVPMHINADERALWEQLAAKSKFNPRD